MAVEEMKKKIAEIEAELKAATEERDAARAELEKVKAGKDGDDDDEISSKLEKTKADLQKVLDEAKSLKEALAGYHEKDKDALVKRIIDLETTVLKTIPAADKDKIKARSEELGAMDLDAVRDVARVANAEIVERVLSDDEEVRHVLSLSSAGAADETTEIPDEVVAALGMTPKQLGETTEEGE